MAVCGFIAIGPLVKAAVFFIVVNVIQSKKVWRCISAKPYRRTVPTLKERPCSHSLGTRHTIVHEHFPVWSLERHLLLSSCALHFKEMTYVCADRFMRNTSLAGQLAIGTRCRIAALMRLVLVSFSKPTEMRQRKHQLCQLALQCQHNKRTR
jgi:hypothetical protein